MCAWLFENCAWHWGYKEVMLFKVFCYVRTCAFEVSLEEEVREGARKVVVRNLGELDTTQIIPLTTPWDHVF